MESLIEFSQELAVSLYESAEEFPISFEECWQWLGYSRKDTALDTLKSYFVLGVDFTLRQKGEWTQAGRSSDLYGLTIDCFKQLAMLSKTEKGRQVRLYFLECEKIAKKVIEHIDPALLKVLTSMQKEMKLLSERTQKLDSMEKAASNNKGIKGVIDTEILEIYPKSLSYTVKEYLIMKGVEDRHLSTMRKRAVMFTNQGKQTKLPAKGTEYVFIGNDISYLDQALKTVLGLD